MIRVGLIGYGLSGRVFHAPYISATDGLQLTAIATSQAEAAKADYPEAAVRTPDDVIAAPDIDLVIVAAPNPAHASLATAALRAGKDVVVDKPLAVSLAEGRRLVDEARASAGRLFPFHNRRWDDDFLTAVDIVADGAIGDLVTFELRFDRYRPAVLGRWRERPGAAAGIWWDLGPHMVDQAFCLLGRPEAVSADMVRQRAGAEVTDYVHVVLHYGTRRAILHAGALAAGRFQRLSLNGTEGAFTTWGFDPQEGPMRQSEANDDRPRVGELTRASAEGLQRKEVPLKVGGYGAFYRAVKLTLRTGAEPPVSPEDAIVGLEIIEAAERSATEGRTIQLGDWIAPIPVPSAKAQRPAA